jgi:hypothetical protein
VQIDIKKLREQIVAQNVHSSLALCRAETTAFLLQTQGRNVLSGPYSGMVLLDEVSWADGDIAPKLLGTYEEELHAAINKAARRHPHTVVNVGCAEGFHAVGLARLLPEARIFAFDIDPKAQTICRRAAEANGVGGRISVSGACSIEQLSNLVTKSDHVLLFLDCEGVEKDLLTPPPPFGPDFRNCDIVIECHDFIDRSITTTLTQRFTETHTLENIIEGPRNPNRFDCLRRLPSINRWLAVDENRPELMNWLVCWSASDR